MDEKDTPYLALAIEFDIELVTKDEELVVHLRGKGFQKVLSLSEFLGAWVEMRIKQIIPHETTAHHLLETDDATWRFRHLILQAHYAKQ